MKQLDQFFTTPATAGKCVSLLFDRIPTDRPAEFIEPSAGDGVFYTLLPKSDRIGVDIDPRHPDIIKANFLRWKPEPGDRKARVVIGNPPFGKRGDTAVQFIQHAAEIADTIGFILPMCFRKYALQRKIPTDLNLVVQRKLGRSFRLPDGKPYLINTIFQVWTRDNQWGDKRRLAPEPIKHQHFEMHQYNNTREALRVFDRDFDFAVPCQGWQDYSRRETNPDNCEKNKQWMLIRGVTGEYTERLDSIDYNRLATTVATTTPGFRKGDLVEEYGRLERRCG